MKTGLIGLILKFAGQLKFRTLFLLSLALLVLDLIIRDPLPFIDELLLGCVVLLLSSWKKKKDASQGAEHVTKKTSSAEKAQPTGQIIEGEYERKE